MSHGPKSVRLLARILGLMLVSVTQAQQPVTLKKVSNTDGLTLGNGVSLARPDPAYSCPFEMPFKTSRENGTGWTNVHMFLVVSERGREEATGANVEITAHYLFASETAKTSSARATTISEEAFRLVIVGETDYGDRTLRDAKLRPEAAALIQQGKMDEFSKEYGTHFVLREHRVARIVLTISVDRWSGSTVQKLRTVIGGGGSIPLIDVGADLKVSIQNDFKEANKRRAVQVDISTLGGTGLQSYGDTIKALIIGSSDYERSIGESIRGMMTTFDANNSGIGAVTVASYEQYGWDPKNITMWNDLFEDKLQRCADRYYSGRKVERAIRRSAIPNASPSLREKLEAYVAKYDDYLSQLANFQRELLNKNEEFVRKQFPKEPEMDGETAKALAEPQFAPYVRITPYVGIRRSTQGPEKTYVDWTYYLGNVDTTLFRVTISSLPESDADIIADDGLLVNGHWYGGWSGLTADPGRHLDQNPVICYHGVPAIDISKDLRRDGLVMVRVMDTGGGVYGCSNLYLRVTPK